MQTLQHISHPVILFDGVCNLCNSSVQKVIKYDPQRKFRFTSLQGQLGQEILRHFNLPADQFNSFSLYQDGHLYFKSTAAIKVMRQMNGGWKWLSYLLWIVPFFIRDFFYDFIARNRYKWFGKQESCWLPTPSLKELFYD
jgi:predicted DCC family thiol-disulfide oxidoreductase YuxK